MFFILFTLRRLKILVNLYVRHIYDPNAPNAGDWSSPEEEAAYAIVSLCTIVVIIITIYFLWNFIASKPIIATILAVTLGFFAYFIRSNLPRIYAYTEMTISIAAIYVAFGDTDIRRQALQIAAGVYIFVRGLDNLEKAKAASLRKP